MLRRLLWKDVRVDLPAIVGGAVVAACPYAVVLPMQAMYPPQDGNTMRTYGLALERSAAAGLLLTLLMAAVFGGVAFAAERRDRSAEFLAMLPASRGRIVLSKLLVAVPCLVLTALAHYGVLLLAASWRVRAGLARVPISDHAATVMVFVSAAILFFGLAWMLSLYLHSPAIAASIAVGAGVLLYFLTATWAEEYVDGREGIFAQRFVPLVLTAVSVGAGALAFAGSTAHYLRRVRP